MKNTTSIALITVMAAITTTFAEIKTRYTIVDTGQIRCYDDRTEIEYPLPGRSYFGQDAQYEGSQPAYRDNGDGTIHHFAHLDSDNDGYLSEGEAPPPPMHRQRHE